MTGKKGRSGGARRGSGPYRRRITLSAHAARQLAHITRDRRALLHTAQLSEHDVVAWLIDEHYRQIMHDEAALRNQDAVLASEDAYLQLGKQTKEGKEEDRDGAL